MAESQAPTPSDLNTVVHATYLRGGTSRSDLRYETSWSVLPYTLIGQAFEGPIVVQLQGQAEQRVSRGGGYVIPVGRMFRVRQEPAEAAARRYHWMHVHLRVFGDIDLSAVVDVPAALPPARGRKVGRIARDLARCHAGSTADVVRRAAELKAGLYELVWLLVSMGSPRAGAERIAALHARLRPVLRLIGETFTQPMTREQLAAHAGLSPSRFHALFQEAMGMPPVRYVQQLRLRRAQELLLASDLPVKQIADQSGFNDAFHFSRLFRREVGLSPRDYRRQFHRSLGLALGV